MDDTTPLFSPPPDNARRGADLAASAAGRLRPGALSRPSGPMSDDELIATWQLFRTTMGCVDGQLATALVAGQHQPAIFYEALAALADAPDRMLPMSDLAGKIGMSSGGLTKLVDRMVQSGFVDRHHSPTDRRVVYAVLTDKGAAHERRSTPAYAAELRGDFAKLGPDGLDAVRAVCHQIQANLAASTEPRVDVPRRINGVGRG